MVYRFVNEINEESMRCAEKNARTTRIERGRRLGGDMTEQKNESINICSFFDLLISMKCLPCFLLFFGVFTGL